MSSLNLDSLTQALTVDGLEYRPREHLSPKYQQRPRGRSTSRDSRHRNLSGASISSREGSTENLLMPNLRAESALVHPRVRSLTPKRRRESLPCPSNLLLSLQQPWNRSFSETEENANIMPQNVNAQNYSLIPMSSPASPASPDIQSYDVVDHPCTDPNSNITNGDNPNNRLMEASGVSAMTVSNESVFTNGESISPTSSEEGAKCIADPPLAPLSHSASGPVYLPSIGSFAGPEDKTPGEDTRSSFKRQLSVPSSIEALKKVNDVRRFLQANDSEKEILTSLQRVESFVNKKKNEGKRRKTEERNASSQE